KYDSPVFLEVDKSHLQQVNYPITLIPKTGGRYEVVLPDEGQTTSLYSYVTENLTTVSPYNRPANKVISVNEWYVSPNFKFRLVKNPQPTPIVLENILLKMSTVNQTVNDLV